MDHSTERICRDMKNIFHKAKSHTLPRSSHSQKQPLAHLGKRVTTLAGGFPKGNINGGRSDTFLAGGSSTFFNKHPIEIADGMRALWIGKRAFFLCH